MILLLGYGMIGKQLYQKFLSQNIEVKVFGNDVDTDNPEIFHKGNFEEIEKYSYLLDNVQTVVHLIHTTVPSTSFDNPLFDLESNVVPTLKLLKLMLKKDVKRIIFVSTGGAIYGIPQKENVTEKHSTFPISPYGISKLTIEKYLYFYKYSYDFDISILRPSNVYGIGQTIHKPFGLISQIIYNIFNNNEINIWGDGNTQKDYLYLDDLIEALFMQIISTQQKADIYNISYEKSYSIRHIVNLVSEISGKIPQVVYKPAKIFDVPNIFLDSYLFRTHYKWKPKFSIEQGIKKIVTQYK